jgi:hypothetical protein
MSCQVKTSAECQLRDKKTPIFFHCFISNRLSHCWSRCRRRPVFNTVMSTKNYSLGFELLGKLRFSCFMWLEFPKVILNAYQFERFFARVQLNMPPETKTDCETKKHLSVSEKWAICFDMVTISFIGHQKSHSVQPYVPT